MMETMFPQLIKVVKTLLPSLAFPLAPNPPLGRHNPVKERIFTNMAYRDLNLNPQTTHSTLHRGGTCAGRYLGGQGGQTGMHQQDSYPLPTPRHHKARHKLQFVQCKAYLKASFLRLQGRPTHLQRINRSLPKHSRPGGISKSLSEVVDLTHHTPSPTENVETLLQPTKRPDMGSMPTLAQPE